MIPFSVEWEENCWALKDNPEALAELIKGKDYACKLKPIVKQGFKQLNLINFFTAGEKEVSVPLGPSVCPLRAGLNCHPRIHRLRTGPD